MRYALRSICAVMLLALPALAHAADFRAPPPPPPPPVMYQPPPPPQVYYAPPPVVQSYGCCARPVSPCCVPRPAITSCCGNAGYGYGYGYGQYQYGYASSYQYGYGSSCCRSSYAVPSYGRVYANASFQNPGYRALAANAQQPAYATQTYAAQPQYYAQPQYAAQPQYYAQPQYAAQPQYYAQPQYAAYPQYAPQYAAQPQPAHVAAKPAAKSSATTHSAKKALPPSAKPVADASDVAAGIPN